MAAREHFSPPRTWWLVFRAVAEREEESWRRRGREGERERELRRASESKKGGIKRQNREGKQPTAATERGRRTRLLSFQVSIQLPYQLLSRLGQFRAGGSILFPYSEDATGVVRVIKRKKVCCGPIAICSPCVRPRLRTFIYSVTLATWAEIIARALQVYNCTAEKIRLHAIYAYIRRQ